MASLPVFVCSDSSPLPRWADRSVALGVGTSAVHLATPQSGAWKRAIDCRGCVVLGRGVLTSIAAETWHETGFRSFLRDTDRPRSIDVSPSAAARILKESAEIASELGRGAPGGDSLILASVVAALVVVYREDSRTAEPRASADPIRELVQFVDTHYTDPLTLEELADRSAMSPTHLSHRFREEIGKPLFAYINQVRIDRACSLLKRSNRSVVDVAYAVGYNSLSFFNRYFRRLTGASPTEYRRNIRSEDRNIVVENPSPGEHT